jgi:hypothetical protein
VDSQCKIAQDAAISVEETRWGIMLDIALQIGPTDGSFDKKVNFYQQANCWSWKKTTRLVFGVFKN